MLKRINKLELNYVELAKSPNIKAKYNEAPVNVIEPLPSIQNLNVPYFFSVGRAVYDAKCNQWVPVPA